MRAVEGGESSFFFVHCIIFDSVYSCFVSAESFWLKQPCIDWNSLGWLNLALLLILIFFLLYLTFSFFSFPLCLSAMTRLNTWKTCISCSTSAFPGTLFAWSASCLFPGTISYQLQCLSLSIGNCISWWLTSWYYILPWKQWKWLKNGRFMSSFHFTYQFSLLIIIYKNEFVSSSWTH